ncbi:MAG: PqqD family protein [Gammaproteobacteria bacterium]|nr:PqqD family protein [Gammaproteobacteria bacterium]
MDNLQGSKELYQRLALSENGFVFDPVSGQSFTVNETGIELLRLLQKSADIQQVQKALTDIYEAQPNELERDINDFTSSLSELMS